MCVGGHLVRGSAFGRLVRGISYLESGNDNMLLIMVHLVGHKSDFDHQLMSLFPILDDIKPGRGHLHCVRLTLKGFKVYCK